MLNLKTTTVKSVDDTPLLKNAFQIITTEEKSFTVYVSTPTIKEEWLKDFNQYTVGGCLSILCITDSSHRFGYISTSVGARQ
jgi:hypothetical protein